MSVPPRTNRSAHRGFVRLAATFALVVGAFLFARERQSEREVVPTTPTAERATLVEPGLEGTTSRPREVPPTPREPPGSEPLDTAPATARFYGVVVDAAQDPVPGARIQLARAMGQSATPVAVTTSAADGSYELVVPAEAVPRPLPARALIALAPSGACGILRAVSPEVPNRLVLAGPGGALTVRLSDQVSLGDARHVDVVVGRVGHTRETREIPHGLTYQVRLSAERPQAEIRVPRGSYAAQDVRLDRGRVLLSSTGHLYREHAEVMLRPLHESTYRVLVHTAGGAPLPGAVVAFDDGFLAATDEHGRSVRVRRLGMGLPLEPLPATIRHPEFEPQAVVVPPSGEEQGAPPHVVLQRRASPPDDPRLRVLSAEGDEVREVRATARAPGRGPWPIDIRKSTVSGATHAFSRHPGTGELELPEDGVLVLRPWPAAGSGTAELVVAELLRSRAEGRTHTVRLPALEPLHVEAVDLEDRPVIGLEAAAWTSDLPDGDHDSPGDALSMAESLAAATRDGGLTLAVTPGREVSLVLWDANGMIACERVEKATSPASRDPRVHRVVLRPRVDVELLCIDESGTFVEARTELLSRALRPRLGRALRVRALTSADGRIEVALPEASTWVVHARSTKRRPALGGLASVVARRLGGAAVVELAEGR